MVVRTIKLFVNDLNNFQTLGIFPSNSMKSKWSSFNWKNLSILLTTIQVYISVTGFFLFKGKSIKEDIPSVFASFALLAYLLYFILYIWKIDEISKIIKDYEEFIEKRKYYEYFKSPEYKKRSNSHWNYRTEMSARFHKNVHWIDRKIRSHFNDIPFHLCKINIARNCITAITFYSRQIFLLQFQRRRILYDVPNAVRIEKLHIWTLRRIVNMTNSFNCFYSLQDGQ